MTRLRISFVAATCLVLTATAVSQGAVTATWSGGRIPGTYVDVTLNGSLHSGGPSSAGVFQWTGQNPNAPDLVNRNSTTGALEQGGDGFISFCLELTQTIATGTITFDLVDPATAPQPGSGPPINSPMGVEGRNYLNSLGGRYLATAIASGADLADRVAAFQIAVWKLDYDGKDATYANRFDLTQGFLRAAPSAATTLAQTWLNAIKAADWNQGLSAIPGANLQAYALTEGNVQFQDQLAYASDSGATVPTPEPTTIAIWLVGMGIGLAAVRRKKA